MTLLSSQLAMFPQAARPGGLAHAYVPILLAKRGEVRAMEHLGDSVWESLTPWLRVLPPELRSGRDDEPPVGLMTRLGRVLGDRPVYLDVAGVPRRSRQASVLDEPYVKHLYEAALAANIAFAPVYPLGRRDLTAEIGATGRQMGLGAAVAVPAQNLVTWGAERLRDRIEEEVRMLGFPPSELDLMLDLGYLAPGQDDPTSVLWLLREVANAQSWRSVVLAGTAVPDSVAEEILEDSLNGIPRRDLDVFNSAAAAVPFPVRYADYGIQHPVPPTPGPVPKMRASIRYTAGRYIYVARGSGAIHDLGHDAKAGQYRELAIRLRLHPRFIGRGCCWGDELLEDLADGASVVLSQETLRAASTCHHLSAVAHDATAA